MEDRHVGVQGKENGDKMTYAGGGRETEMKRTAKERRISEKTIRREIENGTSTT